MKRYGSVLHGRTKYFWSLMTTEQVGDVSMYNYIIYKIHFTDPVIRE